MLLFTYYSLLYRHSICPFRLSFALSLRLPSSPLLRPSHLPSPPLLCCYDKDCSRAIDGSVCSRLLAFDDGGRCTALCCVMLCCDFICWYWPCVSAFNVRGAVRSLPLLTVWRLPTVASTKSVGQTVLFRSLEWSQASAARCLLLRCVAAALARGQAVESLLSQPREPTVACLRAPNWGLARLCALVCFYSLSAHTSVHATYLTRPKEIAASAATA